MAALSAVGEVTMAWPDVMLGGGGGEVTGTGHQGEREAGSEMLGGCAQRAMKGRAQHIIRRWRLPVERPL